MHGQRLHYIVRHDMSSDISTNWNDDIGYPDIKKDIDENDDEIKDWMIIKNYYKETEKNEKSFFYNNKSFRQLDIFFIAMSIGIHDGEFKPWESLPRGIEKVKNMPTSAALKSEENKWLMIYAALRHISKNEIPLEAIKILNDKKKIISICEGYANGGIRKVIELDNKGGLDSFIEEFESIHKKIDKNANN